jgi:hypothetical protein
VQTEEADELKPKKATTKEEEKTVGIREEKLKTIIAERETWK